MRGHRVLATLLAVICSLAWGVVSLSPSLSAAQAVQASHLTQRSVAVTPHGWCNGLPGPC